MILFSGLTPNKKILFLAAVFMALCILLVFTGCSAHERTSRTVTTSESGQSAGQDSYEAASDQDTSSVTTQETVTTTRASDGGIMGGAFHLVGEVLAFPFRVIAAVFDAVF